MAAQRTTRRRAAGVAVSLALHVAALSWLGLHVARLAGPEPPPDVAPLTVELVRPPPLARAAPPQAAPRAPPAAAQEAAVLPRPRQPAPVSPRLTPKPLPLPPAPAGADAGRGEARGGAGPVGARTAPGPLPGSEMQGDLRGFLRGTVGCSHEDYLRLTPAERARCDSGFATAARTAPAIPLPDDKLAEYARGADANARKRARREGPLYEPMTACDVSDPASRLGLGCVAADAHHTVAKF